MASHESTADGAVLRFFVYLGGIQPAPGSTPGSGDEVELVVEGTANRTRTAIVLAVAAVVTIGVLAIRSCADPEPEPAAGTSASSAPSQPPLAVSSRVVFAITPGTFAEGEVKRIVGERVTVAHEFGGESTETTIDRSHVVPPSAAAANPRVGEYLLTRAKPKHWQACRVEAIDGARVHCSDPGGRRLERDPAELLRPSVRLQKEMARYRELHARYRAFDAGLRAAGKPQAPPGYEPEPGDQVIAHRSGTGWYAGTVVRIDGTRAELDWSAPTADKTVSIYDLVPLPKEPQVAAPGQYCLVRPDVSTKLWKPHKVIREADKGSYELMDREGTRRRAAATGILPLAQRGGPERPPDAGFVVTPPEVVDAMLELAEVGRTDVVYDLGCGDGRVLIAAAKKYGARAVGYDIDPARVAESRQNARQQGVEHLVRVEVADIFTVDLSGATVVTLYLGEELNTRLLPQLRRLAPGVRVVSHAFTIRGLPPERSITVPTRTPTRAMPVREGPAPPPGARVFLWRAPLGEPDAATP